MNNTQLDPVSALVAIFTVMLGPSIANIVGPYAVIIIAATLGASWALGRRDPTTKADALWFFVRLNLLAMLITVSLAEVARNYGAKIGAQYLLVPIALLIGAVGDDWPTMGKWCIRRVGRFIDFWIEMRTGHTARQEDDPPPRTRWVTPQSSNRDDDDFRATKLQADEDRRQ